MSVSQKSLPDFSVIDYAHVQSSLETMLKANREKLEMLLANTSDYTWENLMAPMEEADDELHRFWSRISHLNNVKHCAAVREVYDACIPMLTAYSTELSHHRGLYDAVRTLSESKAYDELTKAQKKSIEHTLRDFRLAGVHLPDNEKKKVASLSESLASLSTQFSNHVLDATQAWSYFIEEESQLAGIPDHVCMMAKAKAESEKKEGWLFSLDFPIYYAVMSQAENRSVREAMQRAYLTRASDVGPNAGRFDNGPIMTAMLKNRFELASVLGFDTYAHYGLATRMVKKPEQVMDFIHSLGSPSVGKAKKEYNELVLFAKEKMGLSALESWDIAFVSERMRQEKFNVSQEALRPYFPFNQVIISLCDVIKKLFGITLSQLTDVSTWHDDVSVYSLHDSSGQLRAYCYVDPYARSDKQGGAWMADFQGRRLCLDGSEQIPIALVNCNFMPPSENKPSLLTFDDVETLFHEFGHALQHMLTTVNSSSDVAGINGIPWDAVEFPSQFMEHWAWEKEIMLSMAKHYETQEPLPEKMIENMHAARYFQSAMRMSRQLEFSYFDMSLHTKNDFSDNTVKQVLDDAKSRFTVTPVCEPSRFANTFAHIFAGGYAAGYYSYKWAEVMAVDAFHLFQSRGGFDDKTAKDFLACVLEPGGSEDPDILFRQFANRDPDPTVLLRHDRILEEG